MEAFFTKARPLSQRDGSGQPLHAGGLDRIEDEGGRVLAASGMGAALDRAVCNVSLVGHKLARCLPDNLRMFYGRFAGTEQGFQSRYASLLADG